MALVLDLTSRTVAFISLIQDIIVHTEDGKLPNTQIHFPILHIPQSNILQKIRDSNTRVKAFQERATELIWVSKKAPDRGEVQKEFIRRCAMLLDWLQGRQNHMESKLMHYMPSPVAAARQPGPPPFPFHTSPSPHQWREVVRDYLYEFPQERIALAKALDYLPILVVLGLGGAKYSPVEQRLLQEWYSSEELSDRLLTKKELALLNKWRLSDTDKKAEKLLVNEPLLLRKLRFRQVPVPFELIFHEELQEIVSSRQQRELMSNPPTAPDPLRRANEMKLCGICLSGGGIRSATFNLGILQGLAKHGQLQKIDYLSTVSGGGYIGTWLSAWIKRSGSAAKVTARINPDISKDPRGDEVRPLRWLRMYSNYLTPNSSIMSTDSWTLGLTWLRNTLLNQLIILLLLCTALTIGVLLLLGWQNLHWHNASTGTVLLYSSLLLVPGALIAGWGMHSYDTRRFPPNPFKPKHSSLLTNMLLLFAVAAAYLTSGWLYPDAHSDWYEYCSLWERIQILSPAGLVGWLALLFVSVLGRYDVCFPSYSPPYRGIKRAADWLLLIVFSALSAAVGLLLLALVWELFYLIPDMRGWDSVQKVVPPNGTLRYLSRVGFIVGVPLILEVISLTVVARMALMGRLFPDERREWWGRLGARLHRLALVWVLVTGAVLIGVLITNYFLLVKARGDLTDNIAAAGATAGGWLAIVGTGVRLAFSGSVSGETKPGNMLATMLDNFVRFAPYLFGFGFLLIAANIIYWLLAYPWFEFSVREKIELSWEWPTVLLIGFLLLTGLFIWRVGVNEFSMHHFYRNRLVRAYLGASRRRPDRERTTNTFTGFDREDDLKLATLTCGKGYHGPFPIINATLNATYKSDLDRQDRKAESFVFTPLYCGFDIARTRASANFAGQTYDYGYRPTKQYAYYQGPTIGTAMAISGAAANPNQGYHSSSATAFLLTAFNVRLGWWMGNPRRSTWKSSDPGFGLAYVINDLVGRTSTHDQYVCLSDGGHFDNMGLYELIRRRCRLIILGDAEQDHQFTCQGLANAIRRCRIDFGVEITLDVSPITNWEAATKRSAKSYVHGTIRYPGDPVHAPSGILLYIKSSLTGKEPVDIREYAIANPKFPHQSTGDQFFDEAQFESYRRLGLHIVDTMMLDNQVKQLL